MRIACLLPARNCAPDLPAYLEGVAAFADAVLALDDGSTYGLQLFRAWGEGLVAPSPTLVFRVFAPRAGDELPGERLHLNPVPVSIPSERWIRTTIRVRHLD